MTVTEDPRRRPLGTAAGAGSPLVSAREAVNDMIEAGLLDQPMSQVDAGGLASTGEGGFLPEMIKVRDGRQVRNRAAHIAVGVDLDGIQHVLWIWVQATEGAKFWAGVCAAASPTC